MSREVAENAGNKKRQQETIPTSNKEKGKRLKIGFPSHQANCDAPVDNKLAQHAASFKGKCFYLRYSIYECL